MDLDKLLHSVKVKTLEETLWFQLKITDLPKPEWQYRFNSTRKWTFDFAWPQYFLAVEVEGVTPQGGRHQRIGGFLKDCEKYADAAMLGWHVLRFSGPQVKSGQALTCIEVVLTRIMQEKEQFNALTQRFTKSPPCQGQ